jgi:hypothetical protein
MFTLIFVIIYSNIVNIIFNKNLFAMSKKETKITLVFFILMPFVLTILFLAYPSMSFASKNLKKNFIIR